MKRFVKPFCIVLMIALLCQTAFAASYIGVTTVTSGTSSTNQSYSSASAPENALLVSGGTSTITNPTVTKTGSPTGRSDDYDFYGTNAAVLVYNGATLNIQGGSVTTDGSYANAVYAHGTGTINISDTTIQTSKNNSGGIMVTGGGTLTANNLTVTTSGNSSAAIRSDRGGGTMTINGGTYTVSGTGSPVIYSTADVTVNDATLLSTASEGVVVEGKNSVTLNNVTLTDTNTTHNGKSTTDKNIFLYQSMSGDASVGTASFSATDSTITTNRGDTFYITNTTAAITLKNNEIINNSGDFLRAEAAAWGSSGKNGGQVTMTLDDQEADGDIIIDSISTLDLTLKNGSVYTGTINGDHTAKSISLTLDQSSKLILTGDSYVSGLTNGDATNSNIIFNGHTLYVNGNAMTGDSTSEPEENSDTDTDPDTDTGAAYSDVPAGRWYSDAVAYVTDQGMMEGSGGKYRPEADFTRVQLMAVLARLDGKTVSGANWKADAKDWAMDAGVSDGTNLDQPVTREEFVTMLYRYAGAPAIQKDSGLSPFDDADAVSAWATDAMKWAGQTGLVIGDSNRLNPGATATRAQAAMLLMRFHQSAGA